MSIVPFSARRPGDAFAISRSPSPTEYFTYTPLKDPSDLRLLKLQTRENAWEPVAGSLVVTPTTIGRNNQLQCDIPYHALSYVWGDSLKRVSINLDGKPFLVTENLFDALRQLQRWGEPMTLWIDAICINQEDNTEKGHQVARMNAIFECSQRVIAWLGPADRQSELAIPKLKRMASLWESLQAAGTRAELRQEIINQATSEMVGGELGYRGLPHVLAIQSLFRRPWWGRIWIIQEGTSTAHTVFLCGGAEITRSTLASAVAMITFIAAVGPRYRALRSILPSKAHVLLGLREHKLQGRDALAVVQLAREYKATDLRDKIFALVSLFKNGRALLRGLLPMYGVDTRETYVDFGRYLINNSPFGHQLNILGNCGISAKTDAWGDLKLPSWTPDWRVEEIEHSPLHKWLGPVDNKGNYFRFSGSKRAYGAGVPPSGGIMDLHFNPPRCDGELLTVQACCVDGILKTSGTITRTELGRYNVIHNPYWQVEDKESRYSQPPSRAEGPRPWYQNLQTALHSALPGATQRQTISCTREEARLHTLVADIFYTQDRSEFPQGRGSRALLSLEWEHSRAADEACRARQLIQTAAGRIGLAPSQAKIEDMIYLIYGGQVLYILRPTAEGRYKLVGECYLHGLMDGEGFALVGEEKGTLQWEKIEIS